MLPVVWAGNSEPLKGKTGIILYFLIEKTKTNNLLVHLSGLSVFPSLFVTLSPKHIWS